MDPELLSMPRCTHSFTPGTRGVADPPVLNSNDDVLPMNNLFRNEPFSVSSPDHLPFARLDLHDKTTVVRSVIFNKRVSVLVLHY